MQVAKHSGWRVTFETTRKPYHENFQRGNFKPNYETRAGQVLPVAKSLTKAPDAR